MSKFEKILIKVLRGTSDTNIGFDELVSLLSRLGFQSREVLKIRFPFIISPMGKQE